MTASRRTTEAPPRRSSRQGAKTILQARKNHLKDRRSGQ
jgi:hypothetical protein